MKSELTPRQWALYRHVKSMGNTYTTQYEVAEALFLQYGFYSGYNSKLNFHDTTARIAMTKDIRAINDSSIIQGIIMSTNKGIKFVSMDDYEKYIGGQYAALWRKKKRIDTAARKGARDGQMRLVLGSERDTVKAFIDSDRHFGARLKEAREASNFRTLKQVADIFKTCGYNIDVPMLSKFENGYCLPNKSTLALLAYIYGVTPDYLLTGIYSKETPTAEIGGLQAVKVGE